MLKDQIIGIVGWGDKEKPIKKWIKRADGSIYPFMKFTLRRNYPNYQSVNKQDPLFVTQKIQVILPSDTTGLKLFENLYSGRHVAVVGALEPDGFSVDGNGEKFPKSSKVRTVIKESKVNNQNIRTIFNLTMHASEIQFLDPHITKQGQYILRALGDEKKIKDMKKDDYGNVTEGKIEITVTEYNSILKNFIISRKTDEKKPDEATFTDDSNSTESFPEDMEEEKLPF
jgi:hypothetical protein